MGMFNSDVILSLCQGKFACTARKMVSGMEWQVVLCLSLSL